MDAWNGLFMGWGRPGPNDVNLGIGRTGMFMLPVYLRQEGNRFAKPCYQSYGYHRVWEHPQEVLIW